jgi:hypothetical protein
MTAPGELAATVQRSDLPFGEGERFAGYGIMAQPFRSGHVLALRRFPHTSIGAGYTSVWQCDPDGRWTMWSDVAWLNSCPRYFGSAIAAAEEAAIDVEWPDPWTIRVRIDGILDWRTAIRPTPASRLMTALGSHLPDSLWRNRVVLAAMSRVAGPALRAGAVRLQGRVPSGHQFRVKVPRIWATAEVRATVHGEDLGPAGPVNPQRWLGGFALPNRGLFAIGTATFETHRPAGDFASSPGEDAGSFTAVRSEPGRTAGDVAHRS